MMGINTNYFYELELGKDIVTNQPMEKFYQT